MTDIGYAGTLYLLRTRTGEQNDTTPPRTGRISESVHNCNDIGCYERTDSLVGDRCLRVARGTVDDSHVAVSTTHTWHYSFFCVMEAVRLPPLSSPSRPSARLKLAREHLYTVGNMFCTCLSFRGGIFGTSCEKLAIKTSRIVLQAQSKSHANLPQSKNLEQDKGKYHFIQTLNEKSLTKITTHGENHPRPLLHGDLLLMTKSVKL